MEESLRCKEIEQITSAEEFETQIEPLNIPFVFRGCVKDWRALECWNPTNGGLDYLQERVGSTVVEVMLSKSAPVFYGDIRSHERVPVPFSTFIGLCKRVPSKDVGDAICSESEKVQSTALDTDVCSSFTHAREQIYLAQVPILNRENEERVELESLRADIEVPSLLGSKRLSSINLWMSNVQSRSSTHYDPHHNLLCVVAGSKRVVMWPPSAGPLLYPLPICGEASNHSSVSLDSPDLALHPKFKHAADNSQKVVLKAGDALFIPEGWFHQVDSDELTIAVNFWWRSTLMSSMLEHMDAYYLRRILRRLIDKEMNQNLPKISVADFDKTRESTYELSDKGKADSEGNILYAKHKIKLNVDIKLHDLGPEAVQALREIVSLVHDGLNAADQQDQCTSASDRGVSSNDDYKNKSTAKPCCLSAAQEQDRCTSTSDSGIKADKNCKKMTITKLYHLEDDSIANILWHLNPHALQTVLLAMVSNFPRTLEALILHLLSPVGAEVLTRKFDELDQQLSDEYRSTFYERIYSVFDDPYTAMEAILIGKESFALQAFRNVLRSYVGVNFDGSNCIL